MSGSGHARTFRTVDHAEGAAANRRVITEPEPAGAPRAPQGSEPSIMLKSAVENRR